MAYAFRLTRFLQIDGVAAVCTGAAGSSVTVDSDVGDAIRSNTQEFGSFGPRVVLPLRRIEISAGAGLTWLHYSEETAHIETIEPSTTDVILGVLLTGYAPQPDTKTTVVACPSCGDRRGWGHYALVGISVDVTPTGSHRTAISATMAIVDGQTTGTAYGTLPPARSHDAWLNTSVRIELGF
jgi:hypothetical protein